MVREGGRQQEGPPVAGSRGNLLQASLPRRSSQLRLVNLAALHGHRTLMIEGRCPCRVLYLRRLRKI